MTDLGVGKKRHEKDTLDYTINKLNQEILKDHKIELEVKLIVIPVENSFMAQKYVCNGLLRDGLVAILNLDDRNSLSSLKIKDLAETLQLPYMNSYWDKHSYLNIDSHITEYSINFHPTWSKISLALVDLIKHAEWDSFIIVHEDSESKIGLQHLNFIKDNNYNLKIQKVFDRLSNLINEFYNSKEIIPVRLPKNQDLWKPLLRNLNYDSVKKFLIDVGTEKMNKFLESVKF